LNAPALAITGHLFFLQARVVGGDAGGMKHLVGNCDIRGRLWKALTTVDIVYALLLALGRGIAGTKCTPLGKRRLGIGDG